MRYISRLFLFSILILASCNSDPESATVPHDSHTGMEQDEAIAPEITLSEEAHQHLTQIIDAYIQIGDQLASDSISNLDALSDQIQDHLAKLTAIQVPDHASFWKDHSTEIASIQEQSDQIKKTETLGEARVAYGFLSDGLDQIVKKSGAISDAPISRFVCGMFSEVPHGGVWLQFGDDIRNPYYGTEMRTCGTKDITLPSPFDPGQPML